MPELALLIMGHYLADFPLQMEMIAQNKGKVFFEAIGFHCLTAHAAIHGLVAWAVTGSLAAALIIGTTHWAIDFGKSWQGFDDRWPHLPSARMGPQKYGLYGINVDQALHLGVIAIVALGVL